MDPISPTSSTYRPLYVPPRRKPVPSNNTPSLQHQQAPVEPLNDRKCSYEATTYQNQAGVATPSQQYPPTGQWDPNTYGQQHSRLPSASQTLKSVGSFMKSALKATLNANNLYGNGLGVQPNVLSPQQPGFSPPQPPQPNYAYSTNTTIPTVQTNGSTIVNGMALDAAAVSRLQMCGITPMPGRYWYDNRSGVWGLEYGPCIGLLPPNLSLGGALAPNASGPSTTGVFINGRQIHAQDAAQLQAMGVNCIPGRWWVNADGTYGIEGNMIPWGNLRMQAIASKRTYSHSGYGSWSNGDSFGGCDGQGFNYVGGHDSTGRAWSVSTDGSGYFSS